MNKKSSSAEHKPSLDIHPYVEHEKTQLWQVIDSVIKELVENQDLVEKTNREYIVGYLCKKISESKTD